ncbi:hypothetical protein RND59_00725 [Vibrio ruber]|uniref:Uncharacterized protein n=1 Tax=Vibrio rhizosphaerae TaxID=398736 RepID=A0ABU4ISS5_9VIBR|nr:MULTISPECIES: hypothetical protein [Vibrio]MDW6092440.1 hypothetical protein [Vibrio rhizosphaerae]WNJ95680.1 hypothetical protein RND59_00725 [Vibrio ruber]
MRTIKETIEEKKTMIEVSESELRYLLAAGHGLLENIPDDALSTYTNFTSSEIKNFSKKIRAIMDDNDISV